MSDPNKKVNIFDRNEKLNDMLFHKPSELLLFTVVTAVTAFLTLGISIGLLLLFLGS